MEDWGPLADSGAVLTLIRVVFEEGDPEDYVLPLAVSFAEAADAVLATPAVGGGGDNGRRPGRVLYDALCDDAACLTLLGCIESAAGLPTQQGLMRGETGRRASRRPEGRSMSHCRSTGRRRAEQYVGGLRRPSDPQAVSPPQARRQSRLRDRPISHRRRRLRPCPTVRGQPRVPPERSEAPPWRMLQGLVASEGDGWSGALEELAPILRGMGPEAVSHPGARPAGVRGDLSRRRRHAGPAHRPVASGARCGHR